MQKSLFENQNIDETPKPTLCICSVNGRFSSISYKQAVDYQLQDESMEKLQTIIDFSKKVLQNTKDIDSEFVDIVNDNFWELI